MSDLLQAFLTLLHGTLLLLGELGLLFLNAIPYMWAAFALFFLVVFLVRK